MSRPRFTYPFRYLPSPAIREAAAALVDRIDATPALKACFAEGKMLGVLLTDRGPIYAFSGLAGGKAHIDGFVPPIYDYTPEDGYFRCTEAQISAMQDGPLKARESARLQEWLFRQYKVCNARGEWSDVYSIFSERGLIPPGGTGDCAAPKLLQYAYVHGLTPLETGEFWYGETREQVREQGRFYPACTGKCGPLLSFMMQGLDVEPNPLDSDYLYSEPRIIYSDEALVVADKPSGMLSVPGRSSRISLLDLLAERFGEAYSCHRLDMDTSGLMVYARTREAKALIDAQFARGEVQKAYRARLDASRVPFRHRRKGTIALPLSSDYYDRPRQIVDYDSGKTAITEYEVLEQFPDGEMDVLFRPRTGRTHQLRVHAAHPQGLGRPIKGDRLYGSNSAGRLWLHASSLSFRHPLSGEILKFEA